LLGAGLQSEARLPRYRETIKRACLQGIRALNNGKNASEAACMAVAVLEVFFRLMCLLNDIFCIYQDCPLTNAGIGSNLTLDGNVECDASIMDEESYGAIGAVTGNQSFNLTIFIFI
jgi:taspase (threonine aspartase 1)